MVTPALPATMTDDFYADPEVCQAILMDYYKNPHCSGVCEPTTHAAEATNRACGDIVKLSFQIEDDYIIQARTTGAGCAVSQRLPARRAITG